MADENTENESDGALSAAAVAGAMGASLLLKVTALPTTRSDSLDERTALLRAGAALAEKLPHPPVTRDQLTMLENADNVGDVDPAIGTFGVHPISLEEQLRRAAAG